MFKRNPNKLIRMYNWQIIGFGEWDNEATTDGWTPEFIEKVAEASRYLGTIVSQRPLPTTEEANATLAEIGRSIEQRLASISIANSLDDRAVE